MELIVIEEKVGLANSSRRYPSLFRLWSMISKPRASWESTKPSHTAVPAFPCKILRALPGDPERIQSQTTVAYTMACVPSYSPNVKKNIETRTQKAYLVGWRRGDARPGSISGSRMSTKHEGFFLGKHNQRWTKATEDSVDFMIACIYHGWADCLPNVVRMLNVMEMARENKHHRNPNPVLQKTNGKSSKKVSQSEKPGKDVM